MKSAARAFLLLVLALTLLLSVGAQAADGNSLYFEIDKCIPGNQYTFFVMKLGASVNSPKGDSLYHIDQLTARDAQMTVAVLLPPFAPYEAYVGGVFSDNAASPRKLESYAPDATTPENLRVIEESAFEGSAFTHVILGEQVERIEARAFADCGALTYIYLPKSVTSIADDAFAGSDGIVIGCYSGSDAERFASDNGIPCRVLD